LVGTYSDAAGVAHGFEYDGKTYSRVDFPGAAQNAVFGIIDRGDVVGAYVDTAEAHTTAFVATVSE
jgi:hypothetical protein